MTSQLFVSQNQWMQWEAANQGRDYTTMTSPQVSGPISEIQLCSAQQQAFLHQQQTTAFQQQQLLLQQHPHLHLSPLNSPLSSPLPSPLSSPQVYFLWQTENINNKNLQPSSTLLSRNTSNHLNTSNYGQDSMGATSSNNSQNNKLFIHQSPSFVEQNDLPVLPASISSRKTSELTLPKISRSHSKLDANAKELSKKTSSKIVVNNQRVPENQASYAQQRNKYLQAREEHYRKLLQKLPIVKLSFTSYQDLLFHWEHAKGYVENVPGGIAILVSLPYMNQVKIDLVPVKTMVQSLQDQLSNIWKKIGFSIRDIHNNQLSRAFEDEINHNPREENYFDDNGDSVVFEHRQQNRSFPSLFTKQPSKIKEWDSKLTANNTKNEFPDNFLEKDIATSSVSQRFLLRIHAQRAPRMLQTLQPDPLDRPYNLEYHGEFKLDFRLPPSLLQWYNLRSNNPPSQDTLLELLSKRCLSHRYNKHTGLLMVYIDEIRTRRPEDVDLPTLKSPPQTSIATETVSNTTNVASSTLIALLPTHEGNKTISQSNANVNIPPVVSISSTPFKPLPPTNFTPDGFVLSPPTDMKQTLPTVSDTKPIKNNNNKIYNSTNTCNNNSNNDMLNASEDQRLSPEIPLISHPHLNYDEFSSASCSDYEENEEDFEEINDNDDNNQYKDIVFPENITLMNDKEASLPSKPPIPHSSAHKIEKKLSKAEWIIAKEQQRRKKQQRVQELSHHRKKKSNSTVQNTSNKGSNSNILSSLFPSFSSLPASSEKAFNKNMSNNSIKSHNTSSNNMSQTTSNESSNNTSTTNMKSYNSSNNNINSHNTSNNSIHNSSSNNIVLNEKAVSPSRTTEKFPVTSSAQNDAVNDRNDNNIINRVYIRSSSQTYTHNRPKLIGEFVPKQISPLSNPRLSISNKACPSKDVNHIIDNNKNGNSTNNSTNNAINSTSSSNNNVLFNSNNSQLIGKKSPLPLLKVSLHNIQRTRHCDTDSNTNSICDKIEDVFQADRYEDLYLGAMSFDDEEIQYGKHYSPQMLASFSRSEDEFSDDN